MTIWLFLLTFFHPHAFSHGCTLSIQDVPKPAALELRALPPELAVADSLAEEVTEDDSWIEGEEAAVSTSEPVLRSAVHQALQSVSSFFLRYGLYYPLPPPVI